MSLTIFYNDKNGILGYKNKKGPKVEKLAFFPKGLTNVFGPKVSIFPSFFLGIIGQENVFYDIPEQKNDFLGYKNKIFKNGDFSNFFFLGNIGHENVFYDVLEPKNAYLGY